MDITTVFGTVIPGSSPGRCTKALGVLLWIYNLVRLIDEKLTLCHFRIATKLKQ